MTCASLYITRLSLNLPVDFTNHGTGRLATAYIKTFIIGLIGLKAWQFVWLRVEITTIVAYAMLVLLRIIFIITTIVPYAGKRVKYKINISKFTWREHILHQLVEPHHLILSDHHWAGGVERGGGEGGGKTPAGEDMR